MGRDKKCMLILHDDIPTNPEKPVRDARKDVHHYIKKETREQLIRSGILFPDANRPKKCVCETCLQHILETYCSVEEESTHNESSSESSSDVEMEDLALAEAPELAISHDVQSVVDKLATGALTPCEKILLARALGDSIKDDIKSDIAVLDGKFSNYEYLNELDMITYLENRSKPLVAFLHSCTHSGRKLQLPAKKQINNYICKAVDAVYGARNLKFIAPYSYMENLLVYYSSQSKLASDIYGSASPGGVYKTIKRHVQKQVASKPLMCPDGDVIIAFDNNQVLTRNWKIEVNSQMPTSCITSLCVLKSRTENFQCDAAFSPVNWNILQADQAEMALNLLFNRHSDILNHHRNAFFVEQIEYFTAQNIAVLQGQPTPVRKLLDYSKIDTEPRAVVEVTDLEPININPNSEDRIREVLLNITQQAGIPEKRKWIVAVCDGLPYVTALSIIKNTSKCNSCNLVLKSQEDARSHLEQNHQMLNPNVSDNTTMPLQCIHLKPGNGHIEMNLLRSIFTLLWDPCLLDLTSLLGFRTQKAHQFVMADKDHHMCWQILEVLFEAVTAELFTLFLKESPARTVDAFVTWLSAIKNKTIKFYGDVAFSLLFPVLLFRAGIRQGNSEVALAGRDKASVAFFIGNHPKYQQLVVADLHKRLSYPDNVPFISKGESFSHKETAMQGADFLMEQQVRKTHRWLPPGIPTFDHWVQSARNVQPLEKVLEINLDRLNISPSNLSEYVKKTDTSKATEAFRKLFQEKLVFEDSSIQTPWISSLSGLQLHESLEYFLTIATDNMKEGFMAFCNGTQPQFKQVFIKVSDATGNLDKMTKDQISQLIKRHITRMDPDTARTYNGKLLACKVKSSLITLYNEMIQQCRFYPSQDIEAEAE